MSFVKTFYKCITQGTIAANRMKSKPRLFLFHGPHYKNSIVQIRECVRFCINDNKTYPPQFGLVLTAKNVRTNYELISYHDELVEQTKRYYGVGFNYVHISDSAHHGVSDILTTTSAFLADVNVFTDNPKELDVNITKLGLKPHQFGCWTQ